MGGTTQSKLAFISTTIKKKNEDLNKSKATESEEKVKVKTVFITNVFLSI